MSVTLPFHSKRFPGKFTVEAMGWLFFLTALFVLVGGSDFTAQPWEHHGVSRSFHILVAYAMGCGRSLPTPLVIPPPQVHPNSLFFLYLPPPNAPFSTNLPHTQNFLRFYFAVGISSPNAFIIPWLRFVPYVPLTNYNN